jgi:hypothetical protein
MYEVSAVQGLDAFLGSGEPEGATSEALFTVELVKLLPKMPVRVALLEKGRPTVLRRFEVGPDAATCGG